MKYHTRNVNNLNKLADHTKAAAFKWYQYCLDKNIEVLIYETIRTVEQQKQNVANRASQTMRSYHLVGQALDFVPIKSDGSEDWNGYTKQPWYGAVQYAKQIGFERGGDWTGGFVDSPHLQYNYYGYGTDTGEVEDVQVKPWTNANNPYDGSFGRVKLADGVNAYKFPQVSSVYYKTTYHGGTFLAYCRANGMIGIANETWVPESALTLEQYVAVVTPVGGVNTYTSPYSSGQYVKTVAPSTEWIVWAELNGYYCIGANEWIDGKYVMIK
ncbi:M15 family metallopeptidase [Bacillus sp. S14(2024)]|uniref:M15 family metallopeptidase n=1 Tax=Bacillus sp. S14(2024) TaxID=3162884 RepID=UPI003D24EFBF